MKKLLAIAACACGAAAAQTKAPMEWTPVQTNEISRWKAECRAPKGVVADKASRTVRFLVEATGVSKGETVEFFAIGPLSDRAYESLFVAAASPGDIQSARKVSRRNGVADVYPSFPCTAAALRFL